MVCNECLIRPAFDDTGICPTCEARHEVYAAQASNGNRVSRVFEATFFNLTEADMKQNRLDGWKLVSGTPARSVWIMDLSTMGETNSAA